jgi:pimeloyl-ACP methyl ester carboxylesterase
MKLITGKNAFNRHFGTVFTAVAFASATGTIVSCKHREFYESKGTNWNDVMAGIEKIDLPIDRQNKELGKFEYTYQLRKNSNDLSKTLLVHFVGGPGGAGIRKSYMASKFSQLDIDTRGVKLNSDFRLKPEVSYSSEVFAQDVLDIIKSKQNEFDKIILLGESYGTVPATILAHLIEKNRSADKNMSPKLAAVYLDSTVATAFEGDRGDIRKGFQRIWEVEMKAASAELLAEMKTEKPFGENEIFWGNLVSGEAFRESENGNTPLTHLRERLENALKKPDHKMYFKRTLEGFQISQMSNEHALLAPNSVYGRVMCTELAREGHEADVLLIGGKIEFVKTNLCASGKFEFKPFDSKNFSYSAPTYYFVGGMDPVTEIEDTNYHAKNANKSDVSMTMLLPMGTHISFTSVFINCRGAAIESYGDPKAVKESLSRCNKDFKFYSNLNSTLTK